jgi:hypothetical protein
MKYTKSQDGIERATVNVPMRLTREEVEWIRAQHVGKDVRKWLAGVLSTELWERRAEREDRLAKGYAD